MNENRIIEADFFFWLYAFDNSAAILGEKKLW